MYKKFIKIFLPLIHAWGIFFFILLCVKHNLIIKEDVFFVLAVIAISELLMAKYYDAPPFLNLKTAVLVILRLLFWFFLLTTKINHIYPFGIILYFFKYLVSYIMYAAYVKYKITLIFLSIFCFLYYTFIIRKRSFRFTISFILPLSYLIFFFISYYFDTGCHSLNKIIKQKDVKVIFDLRTLKNWSKEKYIENKESANGYSDSWARARGLRVEGEIIYAWYSMTGRYNFKLPGFFRLNANTGEIQAVFNRGVRDFCINRNNTDAYVGFWSPPEILVVDKDTLKEISSIDFSSLVGQFELLGLYFDSEKNIIYVTASVVNKIIKYDVKSRKIIGILDLREKGIMDKGDIWQTLYRSKTNKLYALTYRASFSIIVEIDPEDLKITNLIKLPDEGNAMAFNEQKNTLLVTGCSADKMWEVDMSTLKIVGTYKIPFGCRNIYIDSQESKVYLLSYITGKLLVFSEKSGRIEKEYVVGEKPNGLFASKDYLYISSNAGIIRIRHK